MHPHPAFRRNDASLHRALVERIGFGMVFAQTPAGPRVGHVALVAPAEDRVQFHLSRSNAMTRHLAGAQALVVVNGPDAYVSSRWYDDPDQVPTWNYVSLEFEGPVRRIEADELLEQLHAISALNEARIAEGEPWTMDKLSDDYRDRLMAGIVGFELHIAVRRETFKLSQNKPADEVVRVAEGLERAGSIDMAAAMREFAA